MKQFLLLFAVALSSALNAQNVGIGNTSPNSKLDVNGDLALREGSPITVAAGSNTITLPASKNSLYRLVGASGAFSINSISAGNDGMHLTLINTTGQIMTITNGTSIQTNTGANYVANNSTASVNLIYNATIGKWLVTGSQGFGTGATGPTGPTGANGSTGPTGATGATGLLSNGSAAGNTPYWNGSSWVVNSSNIYNDGGNVGIGTSIPNATFAVVGKGIFGDNSLTNNDVNDNIYLERNATYTQMHLYNNYAGGGINAYLSENAAGSNSGFGNTNAGLNLWTGSAHPIRIATNSTERLTILSGGNVGINNTNPAQKLDVGGTVKATGFQMPTGAASGYVLASDASGNGTWTSTSSLVGPTGAAGATGPTGAAGTNGTNGATGATGPTGATGTAGTNGTNGATGPTGAAGTNGTNGATGATGPTGATGTAGTNGTNGATGATGAAGTNGTNGATGATGPTGATGTAGTNGTNGATGATGATGLLSNGSAAGNTPYWNGSSWVTNSSNIYNNGGNIGIGTSTPAYQLTLSGVSQNTVFAVDNGAVFASKNASGSYEQYLWPRWLDNIMYMDYGSAGFNLRNNSGVTTMFMTNGGNVGVGTTTPAATLDVEGSLKFGAAGTPFSGRVLTSDASGNATWQALPTISGPTGATGATGTAGTNGTNGATGATGPTGATGTAGTNGTNGATGATGAAGTNGTNGATGATGPTGATGTAGTNGTNGVTGATGAAGTNGTNGATGATGPTGATGTAGTNGTNGVTGPTGTAGTNGATGATGATGLLSNGSAAGNTPYWNGSSWVVNSSNIYNDGGSVGIGTSIPNATFAVVGKGIFGDNSLTNNDVNDNIYLEKNSTYTQMHLYNNYSSGGINGYLSENAAGSSNGFGNSNAGLNLWTASAHPIRIGTNATERVSILSNGNVGIGNTNPTHLLDVGGVVNAGTGYEIGGAAASGSYLRGNGTNFVSGTIQSGDLPSLSGLYVDLSSAQTAAGVKTWSGNAVFNSGVGIGTSAIPKGGVGFAKLAIDGTVYATNGPHIQYTTSQDNYPVFQQLNWSHGNVNLNFDAYYDGNWRGSATTGSPYQISNGGGNLSFNYAPVPTSAGALLNGNSTWSIGMVLTSSGNVGIGTASPSSTLQVAGKITTTNLQMTNGAASGYVLTSDASGNASWTAASGGLSSGSAAGNTPYWNGSSWVTSSGNIYNNGGNVGVGTSSPKNKLDVAGAVAIGSYAGTNTAPSSGLIVSGNVGIGTLDTGTVYPENSSKLYVNGPVQTTNLSASALKVEQQFVDMGGTNDVGPGIMLNVNNAYNSWSTGAITGVVGVPGNNLGFPGGLAFSTKAADGTTTGAPVEQMRLTYAGNLGIGTSSPTAVLSVNGAANNTTGSWGVFSDSRVKTITGDFTDGLNVISRIHAVRYNYNSTAPFRANGEQIGIIAQELEQIAPYMVSQREYGQYKDLREVNNQAYVFLLINAVKEQQAEIEKLQHENQDLKAENSSIKTDVQMLKASAARIDELKTEIELLKNMVSTSSK